MDQEITQPDRRSPARLYPDTALFQELRGLMRNPPDTEPAPLSLFGRGEAAAISLAQSLVATILVNDRRPATYARTLGLSVLTIPDMIVLLRIRQFIPNHTARAMLATSQQHVMSPELIAEADRLLDHLS